MLDELIDKGYGNTGNSRPADAEYSGMGLGIASFILGLISIPFSMVLVGGLYGLIGLVLAIVHLTKKCALRSLAVWGLALSILGLLSTAGFGLYYLELRRGWAEMIMEQTYNGWLNAKAPEFTLKDIEGNAVTLSTFRGRKVILDFWATWCPPCRMEIPHFVELRNKYDANDLVIIGISSEDKETIRSFAKEHKINYPLAVEANLPPPYADVASLPTTFFIDANGIIRHVAEGYHDFDALNGFILDLDRKEDPNKKSDL